jgi:hypothetical protein
MTTSFIEGTDWKILTVQPCDPRDPRVQVLDENGRVTEFDLWTEAAVFYAEGRSNESRIFWHQGDKGWGEGCAPEFEDAEPLFSDDAIWWSEDGGGALLEAEQQGVA